MELRKVAEKTYYIQNPTNIGIYKTDDETVYLIDSGNDKEAGKKILKIIKILNPLNIWMKMGLNFGMQENCKEF